MAGSSTQNESQYSGGKGSRSVPGAILVFSGNAPQLRAYPIGELPLTVDRDKLNLPDPKVSRPHALIIFGPVGWTVRDLGSKNGTWVQGRKIEPNGEAGAASGQVVRCGASLFVLYDDVRRFLSGDTVATDPWVIGPTLKAELDKVALAARNERIVLIGGENGSGKELAAITYHDATGRKGPFLPKNCAEIVPTLAAAELFGYGSGIHSTAKGEKSGLVQSAEGGTLFLDEVGELGLDVQAMLLRMIEKREVMPPGINEPRKVDVRVAAATNRDLRRAVEAGTFRQDLFFRLAQVEVRIPSLRERREEIPWLIDSALREEAVRTAHVSLVEAALTRPWPGNVRELISQVKLAAANAHAGGDAAVRAEHLAAEAGTALERDAARRPASSTAAAPSAAEPDADHGRDHVAAVLEKENWVVSKAQRILGIKHRTTMVRLMKKYGLERPGGDDAADAGD